MAEPIVKKRPFDSRLVDIDLRGKMRTEATVQSIINVEAENQGLVVGSEDITLSTGAIASDDPTVIQVVASGGTAGEDYWIRLRFESSDERQLETSIILEVRDDA